MYVNKDITNNTETVLIPKNGSKTDEMWVKIFSDHGTGEFKISKISGPIKSDWEFIPNYSFPSSLFKDFLLKD